MQQSSLHYSAEEAVRWIKSHEDYNSPVKWKRKHVTAMLKALTVMDDVIHNGRVTTELKPPLARMPAYEKLPVWSKALLDEYLATLSSVYRPNTIRIIREACSRFLIFIEKFGICQPSEITAEIISHIFETDTHPSLAKLAEPLKAAKKARRGKDFSAISDSCEALEKAIEPFSQSENNDGQL